MELLRKVRNRYNKWIQIKNLGSGDVLLASYPKCGNTFCRFVFSHILVGTYEAPQPVDFQSIEYLTPSLGSEYLNKNWKYSGFPRVIKTHDAYRSSFSRAKSVVYVMRDPRDMLISYHKWMQAHKRVNFQGSLDDFSKHPNYGVEAYIHHIMSWQDHWDFVFRYEDLMSNGSELFEQFFSSWEGVNITGDVIDRAVENSLPQNVRKVEESSGNKIREKILDPEFRHVRSGKTGQWESVMKKTTLDHLKEYSDFFSDFGYDLS